MVFVSLYNLNRVVMRQLSGQINIHLTWLKSAGNSLLPYASSVPSPSVVH